MFAEVYCSVTGEVQAVGYRDFVTHLASDLLIVGWIQNKADGTVEVLGQGTPDELKEFVEGLHEGSVLARVANVGVEWRTPGERFSEFKVLF